MPNYTYTKVQKAGPPAYTMLKVDHPPAGYSDIHITIPSDPPLADKDGRIADDEIWKRLHVTFVETSGFKLHCFIKTVKNKYMPFDGSGRARDLDAATRNIWKNLFEDQAVIDAVF